MSKSTRPPEHVVESHKASRERDGTVPSHAVQEQEQMQAAAEQMAARHKKLAVNEGGRTNDSSETDNPPGAVHGVPQPSLKGTWR